MITVSVAVHFPEAFAVHADARVRLRALRYINGEVFVDSFDARRPAKNRLRDGYGEVGVDVGAIATEVVRLLHSESDEDFFLSNLHANCLTVFDSCSKVVIQVRVDAW